MITTYLRWYLKHKALSLIKLRSSLHLLEVRSDRLKVVRSAEHGQQDRVGHKVEPGKGPPLVIQVLHQRLEADLQLLLHVTEKVHLGDLITGTTL